jgi:hypothetical protein
MGVAQGIRHGGRRVRHNNQMNMVSHEAICP